jgi:hypothetical protein
VSTVGAEETRPELAWKRDWEQSRRHFTEWWNREGLVVGAWGGVHAERPHEAVERPQRVSPAEAVFYTDAAARARRNHYQLSRQAFPLDMLPMADTVIGPGSLALCLGSEPEFDERTVWFGPVMEHDEEPEKRGPLRFDPKNRWWKVHEATLRESAAVARGKYLVGCPDLIENIDILASLRGMSPLFLDMIERPEWVSEKLHEINQAYFEVYDRIYEIIKLEDGSTAYGPYKLWGPGKTAKVQCDASTMFSPQMFRKFVVPCLREQCAYLDHSMYHLDGSEEFRHLDALLEIEELDAIEWTPNANLPLGGDPRWYELYRRILDAGKSLQAYLVWPGEIVPLLDAIGPRGLYILGLFRSQAEVETVAREIESYR